MTNQKPRKRFIDEWKSFIGLRKSEPIVNSIGVTKTLASDKAWGETRLVTVGHNFEVHHLNIKAGGYCSRHRHRKVNLFHVVTGRLEVDRGGPCASLQTLGPGDQLEIPPGQWHRFSAVTDCELIEVYWMPAIERDDIERQDEGGMA